MKKMEIDHKLYSVLTMEEYSENPDMYNQRSTAIEVNGGETILPLKNPGSGTGPGVYYKKGHAIADIIKPSSSRESEYSAERVIDFTNARSLGDVITRNNMLRDLQSDLMVGGEDGNIFCLNITQEDTPEMAALKKAINAKQIDKRAYEDRFPQFQNDMRLLKGHSITLSKLIGICNGFDIACILTLGDKDGAANPIGDEISIDLTEGRPLKK